MLKPMQWLARNNPLSWLSRAIVNFFIRVLTKPIRGYTLNIPNDPAALKRHIRKGDVLLVEGNERISECIKYLTQSSWSHACLYVGDEPLKRDPELKRRLVEEYGEEANYLVVEALVEQGVVLSPLAKYRDFNIRICRPYRLASEDLKIALDHVMSAVGHTYDLRNIFDLARYFFPVTIVPPRLGREALRFGSGEPTRAICSSLIAECFALVRFPVVPKFEPYPDDQQPATGAKLWSKLARRRSPRGVFRKVSPTLITPRDFDLSPYFEIVKFNVIESMRFDYRKIVWAEDQPAEPGKLEKSA